MRRFPRREAEVAALARQMISGMIENADDFPSPPLDSVALQACLDAYKRAHVDTVQARAAAAQACDAKDVVLKELVDGMKLQLLYAEHAVKYDEAKLISIGWRKRKEPSAMKVPGQARTLEVVREGLGRVHLKWRRPEDGVRLRPTRSKSATAQGACGGMPAFVLRQKSS